MTTIQYFKAFARRTLYTERGNVFIYTPNRVKMPNRWYQRPVKLLDIELKFQKHVAIMKGRLNMAEFLSNEVSREVKGLNIFRPFLSISQAHSDVKLVFADIGSQYEFLKTV